MRRAGGPRLTPAQWRAARLSLLVVVGTRALVFETSVIAARLFGLARFPAAYDPVDLQPAGRSLGALLTFPIIHWDGDWYLTIARHGYALSAGSSPPARANFFPFYPLVVGGLNRIGVPLVAAAVLVSLGCLALALYALARLVELELALDHPWAHSDTTRLTVLALAISPVAFFFSAAYPEALYLVLSVGVFLCARRGQWGPAGALAGLASATRGSGVLLLLPALFLYLYGPREDRTPDRPAARWRPRYRVRGSVAWLALAPAGMLAYIAYLGLSGADPLAFVRTQEVIWQHELSFPWTTVWNGAHAAWSDLRGLAASHHHATLFGTYPGASVDTGWANLLPFLALLLAVPAVVAVWRRLPPAYGIYVTTAILLNLMSPVSSEPLTGLPRYLTELFPLFIPLGASLAAHPRTRLPVLVLSGTALALLGAEFATWHFVA